MTWRIARRWRWPKPTWARPSGCSRKTRCGWRTRSSRPAGNPLPARCRARARGTTRELRDHGFLVFFAPKDNPEIAGVIFGEHNEHGYISAPIAKYVMETYFAKKEGKPLPKLTPPGGPDPNIETEEPPAPQPADAAALPRASAADR